MTSNFRKKVKSWMGSDNPVVRGLFTLMYKAYIGIISSRLVFLVTCKPRMDDRKYISRMYKKRFGVWPDLDNPKNFNEKNNWRKLNDRRPEYTTMVDKYEFKGFVRRRCGEGRAIPLLGVWDTPDEIDYKDLPNRFVLKANHAGGVVICRDKAGFDRKKASRDLSKTLKDDYFYRSREWPYKNVRRRIICEQYMGEDLTDYKNYCFNGKLMYTFVWENQSRADGRKPKAFFCGAYDKEWRKADIEIDYPSLDKTIPKPDAYDEMVEVAEKLSRDIPFVRVDCYIIQGKIYAGEMTFFPWGGWLKFKNQWWNRRFGELQKLPGAQLSAVEGGGAGE